MKPYYELPSNPAKVFIYLIVLGKIVQISFLLASGVVMLAHVFDLGILEKALSAMVVSFGLGCLIFAAFAFTAHRHGIKPKLVL
jgi:hypothetical protein